MPVADLADESDGGVDAFQRRGMITPPAGELGQSREAGELSHRVAGRSGQFQAFQGAGLSRIGIFTE